MRVSPSYSSLVSVMFSVCDKGLASCNSAITMVSCMMMAAMQLRQLPFNSIGDTRQCIELSVLPEAGSERISYRRNGAEIKAKRSIDLVVYHRMIYTEEMATNQSMFHRKRWK